MKKFSAFQKQYFREYDWRKPDKDGKIAAANFRTDFDAGPIPVGVEFTRSREFHGKREYEATFEVDNTFYSPTRFGGHDRKEVERIAKAAPEILKKVQATIEKFIQEKKPNAIRLAPNEAKKQPLYHAFARYLAKKYGGTVEIKGNGFSEFPGSNTYIVKLPGKKALKEGRVWKAIKTGVKKDWKKKVALALAPGPFTPVALAMTARDIRNAYKGTA